jgi:hypothetical protein
MKYLVMQEITDGSIKNRPPRKRRCYFQGFSIGLPTFGAKKDAKIFDSKKEANKVANLKSHYEIINL